MNNYTDCDRRSYVKKLAAVTLLALLALCVLYVPNTFARCMDPDGCLLPGEEEDPLPPPEDPPTEAEDPQPEPNSPQFPFDPAPVTPLPAAHDTFPTYSDPCATTIFWDADYDGLNDIKEDCLLNRYAPVLYMPFGLDWTRPANVDWYLARTVLRFHHDNCDDDQVLNLGAVTQSTLIAQSHKTKQGFWSGCDHTNTVISSKFGPYNKEQHFFLQSADDSTHRGSEFPAQWKVYGHAYRNAIDGINLQYWFFYPYNDNAASANHEGDWESITVRLHHNGTVSGVFLCAHGDCSTFYTTNSISWLDTTHPIVWVADGSHASYPNESTCDDASIWDEGVVGNNCQTVDAHRWFTWAGGQQGRSGHQGGGVINVGEREFPLNGQVFIQYYSRWGERGETDGTSGPRTPSYQSSWLLDEYVADAPLPSTLPPPCPDGQHCCEEAADGSCSMCLSTENECK